MNPAIMWRNWRFRLRRSFFGLSDEYHENVYEQFFFLKYHGGWGFTEAYNLPIKVRQWFVNRLIEQFEKEREEMDKLKSKK